MSKKKTTEEVLDDAVSNEAAQEAETSTDADESINTDIEILKAENEALKEMLQQKEETILRKLRRFTKLSHLSGTLAEDFSQRRIHG